MHKLLILPLIIFAGSCANNTQSMNNNNLKTMQLCCQPIYGVATDWDNISNDLARNIYRHNRLCESQK